MKTAKKIIGVFLAVLMVLVSVPVSVFAAEGSSLTISTNAQAVDIDIDDDAAFTYYVEIDSQGYNGTAAGSDGQVY